jgi:hypothetical protein
MANDGKLYHPPDHQDISLSHVHHTEMRLIILSLFGSFALTGCVVLPVPHTTQSSPQISGRTLDSRTRRPVVGASIRLANLPKVATTTGSDGRFTLNARRNFHVLWYANPSFVMHFPYADARHYWSGSMHVTHGGYKPTTFKGAKDWPLPSGLPPVVLGDVYLQPTHK